MSKEQELLSSIVSSVKKIKSEYNAECSEVLFEKISKKNITDSQLKKVRLSKERTNNYIIRLESLLFKVADMSMPIFELRTSIENTYRGAYPKKEARERFVKHYEELHKPYDKIKKLCWELLFRIKNVK